MNLNHSARLIFRKRTTLSPGARAGDLRFQDRWRHRNAGGEPLGFTALGARASHFGLRGLKVSGSGVVSPRCVSLGPVSREPSRDPHIQELIQSSPKGLYISEFHHVVGTPWLLRCCLWLRLTGGLVSSRVLTAFRRLSAGKHAVFETEAP